ncbi:MAG: perM [Gammaproteobacteria bacterium]|jgi:putative permease|nr:perM [Gammaproteobacteria bacterium]
MLRHPILKWLNRYFGRPEILALIAVLIAASLVFVFFSNMLAPVFVSIVIAYLLQWPIAKLEAWKMPHKIAVLLVYFIFLGAIIAAILGLLPLLVHQSANFFSQLPTMIANTQHSIKEVSARYPIIAAPDNLDQIFDSMRSQALSYGQKLLSFSLSSISSLVLISIYFILVPLLVYFFLMDKAQLVRGFQVYLPKRRKILTTVWVEVYDQIGHYVRGKVLEAAIMAIVCAIFFHWMDLQYASLMAVLVGLSVIIPYVGAVLVTIPLLIIAFVQWGLTATTGYFVIGYGILITLDANVLVPLIFSEVVDLHPVSIILAILVFGGLLGFWGVFFAIPLASLVKAVAKALNTSEFNN